MSKAASAVILDPLIITPGHIKAGTTVPEVDTALGEVAWVAGTHAKGASQVNCDGSLWTAIADPGSTRPGSDTTKWRRTGPSNQMAAFDDQINTKAVGVEVLTFVLQPGFFTGLYLAGLEGEQLEVTLEASPGGEVLEHWQQDLFEQAMGLFEYLYQPLRALTKFQRQDFALYPDAQLTVTIRAAPGRRVAVGQIVCGFWTTLLGTGVFGGVEYGAGAEVKTYSYIKTNDDGTVTIVPRNVATNITANVMVEADQLPAAFDLLQRVAGKPVAFIASGLPRYDYLNTFGLVSASVSPDTWMTGSISLKVQGYI